MKKKARIVLTIEGVVARTDYGYYSDAEMIKNQIKAEEIQGRRAMKDVKWEIVMYVLSE